MPKNHVLLFRLMTTGLYEDQLRYPGEDGEYEKEKMDELGL
jgi:hypothetical protein